MDFHLNSRQSFHFMGSVKKTIELKPIPGIGLIIIPERFINRFECIRNKNIIFDQNIIDTFNEDMQINYEVTGSYYRKLNVTKYTPLMNTDGCDDLSLSWTLAHKNPSPVSEIVSLATSICTGLNDGLGEQKNDIFYPHSGRNNRILLGYCSLKINYVQYDVFSIWLKKMPNGTYRVVSLQTPESYRHLKLLKKCL